MNMSGIVKAGYFLTGLGIGIFGATMLMKRELEKPIGEIEEYIPLEDREGFGEDFENSDKNSSEDRTSDNVRSEDGKDNQKDISARRGNGRDRSGRGQSRHNNREERNVEFSSNQSEILNYYKSSSKDATRPQNRSENDKRREEFEARRGERSRNQSTRYSKIYQDEDVEEAIRAANSGRESKDSFSQWNRQEDYLDDGPSDDYIVEQVYDEDIHSEYTLERVDENIEIFLEDNPQDFVTMIFYEGDNTLCDDGEQIVPNADEVIGYEALSRLIQGGPGAENGVIFVHNLKTSLNYEVVLDAGSYQDTVVGQFESRLNGDGSRGGSS